jgi:ubiquinone/menaquinone biosynthesis C-methylase UbiE
LLSLPIADESLDLVITAGALEYVNLTDGINELARVIAPGGHLLHLPIHPGVAGKFLEIVFRFRSHPPKEVKSNTERHFRIVHQYKFPVPQVIGWSKTAILAQKV